MDPTETLRVIREALAKVGDLDGWFPGEDVDRDDLIETAVRAFQALDEWMSKSGFKPAQWSVVEVQ